MNSATGRLHNTRRTAVLLHAVLQSVYTPLYTLRYACAARIEFSRAVRCGPSKRNIVTAYRCRSRAPAAVWRRKNTYPFTVASARGRFSLTGARRSARDAVPRVRFLSVVQYYTTLRRVVSGIIFLIFFLFRSKATPTRRARSKRGV